MPREEKEKCVTFSSTVCDSQVEVRSSHLLPCLKMVEFPFLLSLLHSTQPMTHSPRGRTHNFLIFQFSAASWV